MRLRMSLKEDVMYKSALRLALLLGILLLLTVAFYRVRSSREAPSREELLAQAAIGNRIGLRILFGLKDKASTQWDGTISVAPGRVHTIEGWRFVGEDFVEGTRGWKASTHSTRGLGKAVAAGTRPNRVGVVSC